MSIRRAWMAIYLSLTVITAARCLWLARGVRVRCKVEIDDDDRLGFSLAGTEWKHIGGRAPGRDVE